MLPHAIALLMLFLHNRSAHSYPIVSFTCKDLGPLASPDSLCLDVPLYCLLRVDPSSPCGGSNLAAANLSIRVELNGEVNTPNFDLVRKESHLLELHVDYRPTGFNVTSTLNVRASSTQEICSFEANTDNPVVTDCTYPLHVHYSDFPVHLDPGDVFLYWVNFSQSNYDVIRNVSLTIQHHRSLTMELLSVIGGDRLSCSSLACVDVFSNKVSMLTMQVKISTVILPHTMLFINFIITLTTGESPYPTVTMQSFILSPSHGIVLQPSFLSIPRYLAADISSFSFPPHVDEPYHFKVSLSFPCVTSAITIAVQIPTFLVEETNATFFVNVTKVQQVGNISSFLSYSSGATSPLSSTDLPRINLINGFNSTEQVIAEFDTLQQTRPCQNWTTLMLLIEGVSLTRLPSRYIALHDKFTVSLTYTAATDNSSEMQKEGTVTVYDILHVNVTRPDISLPISSHTHDAKDELVMTFGVLHNGTSGVTAWNLSYAFQVDKRLEVADRITYCHTAGSGDKNCTDLPFVNHTIRGFFDKFRLKFDKVKYSLNVTVPQNVAPGIKLPANGTATYRSTPLNHPVLGLKYTNTSKGGVNIIKVILYPWEYNNSSIIATPTESHSSHYVVIGETVDISIRARMPECYTSIVLYSTIPNSVTLNNATVVHVGSELWNRTLEVGDSLASSEFIQHSDLAVNFNFGYNVTVPGNNSILSDEQDFTIGLQTTVLNVPELVKGTKLKYTAFVQTDFGKKTSTRSGYITITEPKLRFGPMGDPNKYDAGDTANVIVSITHAGSLESLFTNAFRVILTVSYPTEFLQLNTSSPTIHVGGVKLSSEFITYDTVAGTLTYNVSELDKADSITASMDYLLQNEVQSAQMIPLDLKLTWDSLPYGKTGGRKYSTSDTHMLTVESPKIYLNYVTSNPDTVDDVLQVGESVSFNVTIVPPEGVVNITVELNSTQEPGSCPMNFTSASVIYVGAALKTSLVVGDVTNSTLSTPLITIQDINSVQLVFGQVNNSYDNEENDYDHLIVQVNGYVSDLAGSFTKSVLITVTAVITTAPDSKARTDLQLYHPILKLYFDSENPSPVDAGDEFSYLIGLHNDRPFTSSYDVILDVFLLDPYENILELPYKNSTFYSTNCDTQTNSSVSSGRFYFSIDRITPNCVWYTAATMTLPDDLITDYYFTVGIELTHYDSSPDPPPRDGKVYEKQSKTMDISSSIPTLSLSITKTLSSVPLPYVSPAEQLILQYKLTLPEGVTENLSTLINATIVCEYCSSLEVNLTRIELGSNINVTQPMDLNQFHFFGNTLNLPDNIKNSSDNIVIFSELRVPTNTTDKNFTITFKKSYTSIDGPKQQMEEDNFLIIRPQLNAIEITSAHVVDLGTNLTVTILVNITSPTPAFHVSINITIPDPLVVVRTTINATGTNVTNSSSQSYPEGTILSLYANQLTGDETVRVVVYGYTSLDAERGVSIKPLADMDYTSLPGEGQEAGEKYHDVIPLPSIVISSLSTNLTLLSTSEKLTIENSLTFNEVGQFDAVFSGLVGPMEELTITVSHNGADRINILGVKSSYKGYTPEYIGTPVITKVNSMQHKITFTRTSTNSPVSACSTANQDKAGNCSLTISISAVSIDKNSFQDSVRMMVEAQHGVTRYNSSFEIDLNTPLLDLTMATNTSAFDKGDFIKLSFQITTRYNGAHLVKAHIQMPCRCRVPPVSTVTSNHPINSITFNSTVMIIEFTFIPENATVNCSFVIDSTFHILLGQKFNFTGMLLYTSLSANASESNAVYSGQLSSEKSVVVNLTVESPLLIKPFLLPDNVQAPNEGYYVASGSKVPVKYSLTLQEVNTDLKLTLAFKNTSTIPVANQFFNISVGKDVVLTDRDHLVEHIDCNTSTKTCVIDFGAVENLGRSEGEGFVNFSFFLPLEDLAAGTVGTIEASIDYTNDTDTDTQLLESVNLLVQEPVMSITNFTHNLNKAADSGDIVTMVVTVKHSNGSVVPAIRPTFALSNLHSSLRLVGDASVTVGGTTREFPASDLANGLVTPDISQSDSMVIKFQVQLQDGVRLDSDILLNISLRYGEHGNLSTSAPMFSPITTPTLSIPSLRLINSSLSATNDKLLSIEEVFVLAADLPLSEASMNVSLTLEITSDLEQLPVKFLDSKLTFPAQSITMQMNQNTNVYRSTIAHVLNTSIVVPGSTNNTENTLRLTVVAVVTDEAANGTKISAMVKARTLQDLNVRRASYNLTVMEPQLNVVENEQVLEMGNPQLVMINITISHSAVSNFPALSFTLEKSLPSLLLLQESSLTSSNADITVVSTDPITTLRAYKAILTPSSSITIGFLVQANKSTPSLLKLNNSLIVKYSSILHEDGLGTLFPQYSGKQYTHERFSCIQKTDKPFRSILDVVLYVVSFVIGFIIGTAIVVTCFACCKLGCCCCCGKIGPSAVAAVVTQSTEEDYYIFDDRWVPYSSLLYAVPEYQWRKRTDSYERKVEQYTWLMEEELYMTQIKTMMKVAFNIIMNTKLLSDKGKAQLLRDLQHNVREVKQSLSESWKRELERIVKRESQEVYGTESISLLTQLVAASPEEEVKGLVLKDCNLFRLCEESNEESDHVLEKELSMLEWRVKFMSHYHLWVKASIFSVLQLPSFTDEDRLVKIFEEENSKIEEEMAQAHTKLEEMVVQRFEREKRTLMRKQMLEEEDIVHCQWFVKQLDTALAAGLIRPTFETSYTSMLRLKSQLSEAMEHLRRSLAKKEQEVTTDSKFHLDELVKKADLTLCGNNCKDWMAIIQKSENALKTVEEKAIQKLLSIWRQHQTDREETVKSMITLLTEQLVSIECMDFVSEREKVQNSLEKGQLLQKARLQAQLDSRKEKMEKMKQLLPHFYTDRRERERVFLSKVLSAFSEQEKLQIVDEHYKAARLNLLSCGLYRLEIHQAAVRTSAKKRFTKMKVFWKKWQLQHKKLKESAVDDVNLCELWSVACYLIKCECTGWQSETTVYAEESKQKETEQEMIKDSSRTDNIRYQVLGARLPPLAMIDTGITQPLPSHHESLIQKHMEGLEDISSRLEEDKTRASRELELKIRRKKLSREQRMPTTREGQSSFGQFSRSSVISSRFRRSVIKIIHQIREEKFRAEQEQQLQNELNVLEKEFNAKKTKAFEKLDRKFEKNLVELGHLSENELAGVLKNIDSWKQFSMHPLQKRSGNEDHPEVTETGDYKPHFLPPMTRERRGTH